MKRVTSLVAFAGLMLLVGCGSDTTTSTPFEQSELEKYVAENPVPLVTEGDFKAVKDADE